MMGGAKAHYDGIVAFSQTDFTEDLKKITVPVLVMHGDDDQIVPYADSGPLSAELVQNGTLKTYDGIPARHADHPGRDDQRRPAGLPAVLTDMATAALTSASPSASHGRSRRRRRPTPVAFIHGLWLLRAAGTAGRRCSRRRATPR